MAFRPRAVRPGPLKCPQRWGAAGSPVGTGNLPEPSRRAHSGAPCSQRSPVLLRRLPARRCFQREAVSPRGDWGFVSRVRDVRPAGSTRGSVRKRIKMKAALRGDCDGTGLWRVSSETQGHSSCTWRVRGLLRVKAALCLGCGCGNSPHPLRSSLMFLR